MTAAIRTAIALLLTALVISVGVTRLGSNTRMLVMDRSNAIPREASIVSFQPSRIRQGSTWCTARTGAPP